MTTEEALEKYYDLGKVIFHKSNKKKVEISAKYGPEALETAVKKLVQERNSSELMYDPTDEPTTGKAFVCAVTSAKIGAPQRFRTYASKDKKYSNCKIWEAARATSAAPTFFAPMTISHDDVPEEFLDGAIGYNNPITEVLNEAGISLDPTLKLGCILSLGCGTKADKTLRRSGRWFGQGLSWGWRMGKVMKDSLTDPDPKHIDVARFLDGWNETYFRFSVPGAADAVKLPEYKKMKMLEKMTEKYMDIPEVADQIEKVARILAERKSEGAWIGLVCKRTIPLSSDSCRSETYFAQVSWKRVRWPCRYKLVLWDCLATSSLEGLTFSGIWRKCCFQTQMGVASGAGNIFSGAWAVLERPKSP